MPFGTTVAAYANKPSKTLTNYKTLAGGLMDYNSISNSTSLNNKKTPFAPSTNGGLSAVGGASNVPVSAGQRQIQNPIFQPVISGDLFGDKSGSEYSYLNKINETNDILNEGSQQKVNLANAMIRRRNAQAQQQATYDQGFSAGGNGGESFFAGDGGASGLTSEQLANARQIANVGRQRGMNDNAIQIALMTSLAESGLKNLNYGDRDSQGLFQQRPSQGWGTVQQVTNPVYAANKFYDALGRTNWQRMTPWQAAQAVQRSFDPTGSNYQRQYSLAQAAFKAIQGNPVGSAIVKSNPQVANFISSFNNRYIDYDGAFGNQCVDLYNYFTRYIGGQNIMVGYAPEIYNAYDTKAYNRTGANVRGQMGYVAIFRPGGSTPSGHVAIVVGDNGNGTLRVLHSNATPAGSRGNTTISNISKASLMGYLVPRKLFGQ
jgi:hypothetical protein